MSEKAKSTAKSPEPKSHNRASKSEGMDFSTSKSIATHIDQIHFLQRTIGNQAVQRMLRSKAQGAESKEQSALHLSPYVAQTMPTQRQEELEEKEDVEMETDSTAVQRQGIEEEGPLQGNFKSVQRQSSDEEEEEVLQGKFTTSEMPYYYFIL